MNKKHEIYAFIDSQNLNLAIRDLGWKLDFRKFRIYLKDKYKVDKAFLFLGYVKEFENLYKNLRSYGYELVFKPTLGKKGEIKGNCDAELVLHCARIEYDNFDEAIIISGDGDFYCLVDFLKKENKLSKIGIPNKKYFSSLFIPFRHPYFFHICDLKEKLEYKKR
jgi:uncharacterized LabA/DUF88 family protein